MEKKYKKIFSYNKDTYKTAYMNWRISSYNQIDNMINIAKGYGQSAFILIDECLRDNSDRKADAIIFPVLFNTNHAIELYLKSIIWSINILLDKDKRFEGKHNIYQLFNVVKSKTDELYKSKNGKEEFKNMTSNLKEYLKELNDTIAFHDGKKDYDGIDFSRYPIASNNHKHFYVDSLENVTIDMENFNERFKDIFYNLECLSEYLSQLIDDKQEQEMYYDEYDY